MKISGLVGKRVGLVMLERRHLAKRVEFLNNPEVQATLNFDYPTSLSKTEAWFSKKLLDGSRMDFAIELNQTNDVIGFGGLINIDRVARNAELYIFIGDTKVWGQGYGRDGYRLLANYGFEELGLERVYLYQLEQNERAIKATTALGWVTEGRLRNSVWSHGSLKSQYVLSMLRSEWQANAEFKNG